MKDESELLYPFITLQQKCFAFDEAVRSGKEEVDVILDCENIY